MFRRRDKAWWKRVVVFGGGGTVTVDVKLKNNHVEIVKSCWIYPAKKFLLLESFTDKN
jgi:hypothetical protein